MRNSTLRSVTRALNSSPVMSFNATTVALRSTKEVGSGSSHRIAVPSIDSATRMAR